MSTKTAMCKHDWVGDDACQYCRVDELSAAIIQVCSGDLGCYCPDGEEGTCPICKLEKVLNG